MNEIDARVYEIKNAWNFEYAFKDSYCASAGPEAKGVFGYSNHIVVICKTHVQRLKEKLVEAKFHLTQVMLPTIPKVGDKAKLLKAMINESTRKGIERTYKHLPL
jgi:hypothetical protein